MVVLCALTPWLSLILMALEESDSTYFHIYYSQLLQSYCHLYDIFVDSSCSAVAEPESLRFEPAETM